MRRRWACLALLLLGACLPASSGALANLETLAAACLGPLPVSTTNCTFDGPHPGASSIASTLPGDNGTFGREAAVTITNYGLFSASAGAGIDYASDLQAFPSQWFEARGIAYARFRDTLTATGATGSGLIRMRWEIDGTNIITIDATNPLVISDTYGEIRMVAICGSGPGYLQDCTDGPLVFTNGGAVAETLTFDIPITFGAPAPYLIALELHALSGFRSFSCDECIVDYHANTDADWSSTGRLVSVQLFDGASNELSPTLIESESGFDYAIGAPEPGHALLTAVGALVLLAARRRR
jgi:hypothetical protein